MLEYAYKQANCGLNFKIKIERGKGDVFMVKNDTSLAVTQIVVFSSTLTSRQKNRLEKELTPKIKGKVNFKNSCVLFGPQFFKKDNDTANHASVEMLFNKFNKTDNANAILVVDPKKTKSTISAAAQVMRLSEATIREINNGDTAIVSRTGVQYISF